VTPPLCLPTLRRGSVGSCPPGGFFIGLVVEYLSLVVEYLSLVVEYLSLVVEYLEYLASDNLFLVIVVVFSRADQTLSNFRAMRPQRRRSCLQQAPAGVSICTCVPAKQVK
jgi:hypothetical protein